MTVCPSCAVELARGQQYCVECGVRLRRDGLAAYPSRGGGWGRRTLAALALALAGTAAAIAATRDHGGGQKLLVATGGFAPVRAGTLPPPSDIGGSGLVSWPARRTGWTIALASLPQTEGRKPAVDRAHAASKSGLAPVGILDSSDYASLHPGYWIVFTGVYGSQPEAASTLPAARSFSSTAAVRRIVP